MMKKLILVIILTCLFISIVSCGRTLDKPIACVIVVGHHANSRKVGNEITLLPIIKSTYSRAGDIRVIEADGTPEIALSQSKDREQLGKLDEQFRIKLANEYEGSKEYWNKKIKEKSNELLNDLENIMPDEKEVDTLKAIQVAVDTVNHMAKEMGQNASKKIVICDTGLSTTGSLNFTDEANRRLLYYDGDISKDEKMKAKVAELVSKLKEEKELDNLNGITVEWYGLGRVSGEQPELSNLTRSNLQYIWCEILKAANVSALEEGNYNSIFCQSPAEGVYDFDVPVSVVKQETIDDIVKLKIEGFKPGEDVFYSNTTPEDQLAIYCRDVLDYYPDMEILVVGTTASTHDGGSVDLADKRANKVKEMLIALGIKPERIKTLPSGANNLWHVDEYPNGKYDENLAQLNRAAFVLPFESKMAQDLYFKK